MSKIEDITIDSLGLEFMEINSLVANLEAQKADAELSKDDLSKNSALTFGPQPH